MKILSITIYIGVLLNLGCASISNTDSQDISITARDKVGIAVTQASCEWRNSKGHGSFTPPAILKIRRDYDPLQITCTHPTLGKVNELINSKGSTALAGNAIAGGLIGAAIDHSTGAGYQYPANLSIWFPALADPVRESVARASTLRLNESFRKSYSPVTHTRVEDVAAVPWLSDSCRQRYEKWLLNDLPRGFAISKSGHCGFSSGVTLTNDLPSDPAERALVVCQKMNRGVCLLYAIDNDVVLK